MEFYRFYRDDWCENTSSLPLSIASFNNCFDDCNLALFASKKDQCDTSIRPGRTAGDPTVTDIRAIQYNENGIMFKVRHFEDSKQVPCRFNKKDRQIWTYDELPMMYSNLIPIKAEKY
ncbi:hypothetical protein ILUMI_09310 [Ignelater luminosus]|uniref:Uncharacterized protein n=1 Tax=Ignelater luminosus TaxID=2038154 RepID=A0A8K0GF64_IGNLU|nr:hypothetical protein ILUMI_09310 [Ignelater luminosus]